jgi:tRNA pseudouridine55 synthase
MQLGATTPSYDMEKEVDATYPTEHITRALVDETIPQFLGEQWQVPPMFSAVQINGKRAYELARKGQEVELKPKLLKIDEIEVLSFDEKAMLLTIRVVCSKGTYIRALARDIGERLHSGAYLTALRRTRVGDTRVEDCLTIERFLEQLNEIEYVQNE